MSLFPLAYLKSSRHPAGPRSFSEVAQQRAFTLVEMVVVIAIIVIIISIGAPIVKNIASGNPVSNGVDAISGFLTGARAQAIATNTYVVVGFAQAANSDDLQMAAVRSLNNTFDPNKVYAASSAAVSSYRVTGPIVHMQNVTLQPYAKLSTSLQTKLKAASVPPSSTSTTTSADFIDCSTKPATPATTTPMSFPFQSQIFNWCLIAFTPQGEALYFPNFPATSNSTTPFYSQLFIGVNTSRGGNAIANDISAAGIVLDGGGGNIRSIRL